MSVDAQLERSALERKDRDELHTIAVAMGGKPGSRARKADIIDLIMSLAGLAPSGEADDAGAEADVADAAPEPAAPKPRKKASRAKAPEPVEPPADDDASDEADATDADESSVAEPADRGDDDRANGRDDDQGNARDDDRGNARDDDRGNARDDDRNDRNGRNGEPRRDADQDRGQGGQGDGEPGNRRRRRRGRDRDRDREPEVQAEPVEVAGMLDLRDDGYGFLRVKGYLPSKEDVYVSVKQVRQFGLRKGDHLTGAARPASRNEKNPALLRIDQVNGKDPEQARARARFEDLTPLFPDEPLRLEAAGDPYNMTARIIDLISPIGKGQRGLIVSPPKAGKTTIMKQIAASIEANNPDVHLMVLLVDERPEEVTDMRRSVKGEVVASTFDRPAEEHTTVAELAIERAKRLVEDGGDVVIILDGITRLARAYNLAAPATGRIMSGGIDTGALYPPKKFFGAARNLEEGGSLTILATALVDTGSKMDEVIFEEFKGTGNMELRLDRRMAERRIYPAIDVDGSSTRHEELLYDKKQLQNVWKLRRVLSAMAAEGASGAGLEMLIDRLATFRSNDEFLAEVAKTPAAGG